MHGKSTPRGAFCYVTKTIRVTHIGYLRKKILILFCIKFLVLWLSPVSIVGCYAACSEAMLFMEFFGLPILETE